MYTEISRDFNSLNKNGGHRSTCSCYMYNAYMDSILMETTSVGTVLDLLTSLNICFIL